MKFSEEKLAAQFADKDFNDEQYIFTLDISVIATGFGQLVGEGTIESENKPIIKTAIDRQIAWTTLQKDWPHSEKYIANLKILERVLTEA